MLISDDWEAEELSQLQIEYAAADGAAALEILFSLISQKDLGARFSIDKLKDIISTGDVDLQTCIRNFCERLVQVMQIYLYSLYSYKFL